MIIALEIGRKNSKGFKNKNIYQLDKNYEPLMAYPLIAAKNCKYIDEVFYSTDSKIQKEIAKRYGAKIIDRPKKLATDDALADEVFVSGYKEIKNRLWIDKGGVIPENKQMEFLVLLMANAPCVTYKMLQQMIEILRKNEKSDSICTISKYNQFSPSRIRMIRKFILKDKDRPSKVYLDSFLPPTKMMNYDCDRDSSGDYYIYDCSAAIVRPRCLETIESGIPPQKWLGNKIIPYTKYREIPALDIDFFYQTGQIKMWLEKYYYGK